MVVRKFDVNVSGRGLELVERVGVEYKVGVDDALLLCLNEGMKVLHGRLRESAERVGADMERLRGLGFVK